MFGSDRAQGPKPGGSLDAGTDLDRAGSGLQNGDTTSGLWTGWDTGYLLRLLGTSEEALPCPSHPHGSDTLPARAARMAPDDLTFADQHH